MFPFFDPMMLFRKIKIHSNEGAQKVRYEADNLTWVVSTPSSGAASDPAPLVQWGYPLGRGIVILQGIRTQITNLQLGEAATEIGKRHPAETIIRHICIIFPIVKVPYRLDSWLTNVRAICAGDLEFKSRAVQILHSVANGSPPL